MKKLNKIIRLLMFFMCGLLLQSSLLPIYAMKRSQSQIDHFPNEIPERKALRATPSSPAGIATQLLSESPNSTSAQKEESQERSEPKPATFPLPPTPLQSQMHKVPEEEPEEEEEEEEEPEELEVEELTPSLSPATQALLELLSEYTPPPPESPAMHLELSPFTYISKTAFDDYLTIFKIRAYGGTDGQFRKLIITPIAGFYDESKISEIKDETIRYQAKKRQTLTRNFLKYYIFLNRICISEKLHTEISVTANPFKIFDMIIIDNRIRTSPRQFLDPHNWKILRSKTRMNADVYLQRSKMRNYTKEQIESEVFYGFT